MPENDTPTKTCEWCGETILQVARKCKHCGEFLDNRDTKNSPSVGTRADPVWRWGGAGKWVCIAHKDANCSECNFLVERPAHLQGVYNEQYPSTASIAAGMIVCPHCSTTGRVSTHKKKQKKGVSGGKATAAVLTAGLSVLFTGLSRKEEVTVAQCGNCGMSWTIQ